MRYPKAQWKGAHPNNYSTAKNTPKFIVVHVTSGDNQGGTDSWFNNPKAIVSAHFSIGKDGQVHQYVDTDQQAYAEMSWNDKAISIEHNGMSGDHLTAQQQTSLKALLEWINAEYKIPLVWQPNGNGQSGIVSHGELGVDGGNHPNCPGANIIADVKALIAVPAPKPPAPAPKTRPTIKEGAQGSDVILLQHSLHIPADGIFGPQTTAAVKHYQQQHNLPVDGIVGPTTWSALGV